MNINQIRTMPDNSRALVIGAGKSGVGSACLLEKYGFIPVVYDGNEELDTALIKKKISDYTGKESRAEFALGKFDSDILEGIVLAVPSPGVPTDSDIVSSVKQKNIPVWGEIELAYNFSKGTVIAITGTNGKTTTTSLVGQIMQEYFESAFIVGNIGNPYTEAAPMTNDDTVSVAEISSFQLETIENFHPKVSAILNITPDHLNRHHTMENYVAAKENITLNQTKDDVCVLNYANEYTRAFAKRCPARVVWFSSEGKLDDGLYYNKEDEGIYISSEGSSRYLMNVKKDMKLVGVCNIENVMAAIAISMGVGVPIENILDTIKRFVAVEHRIEYVDTINGVVYYNDSKATNPDAAIQGIRAMDRPTVLIGGGYDKESVYDDWINAFDGKVKKLVLIGQTREKIARCAQECGFDRADIIFADTFEEALDTAVSAAEDGDAVLLSPACASWGMFKNYEERGNIFKDYVKGLRK